MNRSPALLGQANARSRPPSRVDLRVQVGGQRSTRSDLARRLARRLRGFQVSVAITPTCVVLRRPNRGISASLCLGICDWLRVQPDVLSVEPIKPVGQP